MQLTQVPNITYRELITSRNYVDLIQDIVNRQHVIINLGSKLLCDDLNISFQDEKVKEEIHCLIIFGIGLGYFEGFYDENYIENCIIPILRAQTSNGSMDRILKRNIEVIQKYIGIFLLNLNLIYNDRIQNKVFEFINILLLLGYNSGVIDKNQKSKA